ncbi:MAG: hypothetical protein CK425_06615 [Parachlamydia sp.]|nr:MAG: hypothetical protein CK425_06615 [Parachlamydia sp.]
MISKNINLKPLSPDGRVTKKVVFQALQALQDKKKQFVSICSYGVKGADGKFSEEATTHALIQLLKDGLEINATVDSCNTTVLQVACLSKRFEVAKYLIEQGAEINTMTTEGSGYVAKTPLQHAIQNNHEPLILLLLEKGADVNTRNFNKETILHMALRNLKNKGVEVNPKKIIQELLAKNAKVNEADARGATCLYTACEMGELDVVQWLVAKKADVNGFGKYGNPPLFAAVFQGNVEVVRFLLDNGANPKPQEPQTENKNGSIDIGLENNWETPLSIAVWKPNSEMIKLLHAKGADINRKNKYQDAPLHIAARQGDLETVKLLIELGADPFIKNRDEKTAAEVARAKGYDEMAVYLEGLPKSNL